MFLSYLSPHQLVSSGPPYVWLTLPFASRTPMFLPKHPPYNSYIVPLFILIIVVPINVLHGLFHPLGLSSESPILAPNTRPTVPFSIFSTTFE